MANAISLTDRIIANMKEERGAPLSGWRHVPNIITSVFAVIFSMSIVEVMAEYLSAVELFVSGAFIVVILGINEYFKVGGLKQICRPGKKSFMVIFVVLFTYTLSVSLAMVGIYLWLNKSSSIQKEQFQKVMNANNSLIESKNNDLKKLDTIFELTTNSEYRQVYNDLQYNRRMVAVSAKEDRNKYSDKVSKLEDQISVIRNTISSEKVNETKRIEAEYKIKIDASAKEYEMDKEVVTTNNIVSYIFMFLTLLNDIFAIMIAYKVTEKEVEQELKDEKFNALEGVAKYKLYREKFMSVFLLKAKVGRTIRVKEIQDMCPTEWTWEKEHYFLVYGVLINAGIIEMTTAKAVAVIKLEGDEAMASFNKFFDKYLEV